MNRLTTEEFIEKSCKVHNNMYDYSEVTYINNKSKVNIICKEHGLFAQQPSRHMSGQGCPKCGIIKQSKNHSKTTETFIQEAIKKHGNRYSYHLVDYKNSQTKVKIECLKHGAYEQQPDMHLGGSGCPKCAGRYLVTKDIIEQFREVHSDLYDYSLVVYEKAITKVDIICMTHGVFSQTPSMHKSGNGCPKCAKNKTILTMYKNKHAILYYIKINDMWKIGITKRSVYERYKKEITSGMSVEIIREVSYVDGYEAYELEQFILKNTINYSALKENSLIDGGWTEVRTVDIVDVFDRVVRDYNL